MVNSMEFEILFRLRLYYDVDGEAHEIPADEDVSRRCRLAHKWQVKKLDILQKIPGISRFNLSLRKENLLFQN